MNSTRTYVLVPGAWMGAWVWEEVARGLRDLGHDVHPLTLPGLSGEADISRIGLATHISNVLSFLEARDLRQVILVGHLYGGIVVGQVTDRVPERVAHTVYVEAFLPEHGRSLLDTFDEADREAELRQIAEHNGYWPAPTLTDLGHEKDLTAEQVRWLAARFVGHPGRTVREPAVLNRPLGRQTATYIAATMGGHWASDQVQAMRKEPNWTYRTLEAGHWPMVSATDELVDILAEVPQGAPR
jgi:pimeloyl-ACP methyl ester carboxylesterase